MDAHVVRHRIPTSAVRQFLRRTADVPISDQHRAKPVMNQDADCAPDRVMRASRTAIKSAASFVTVTVATSPSVASANESWLSSRSGLAKRRAAFAAAVGEEWLAFSFAAKPPEMILAVASGQSETPQFRDAEGDCCAIPISRDASLSGVSTAKPAIAGAATNKVHAVAPMANLRRLRRLAAPMTGEALNGTGGQSSVDASKTSCDLFKRKNPFLT